jgi:hypothetical protein
MFEWSKTFEAIRDNVNTAYSDREGSLTTMGDWRAAQRQLEALTAVPKGIFPEARPWPMFGQAAEQQTSLEIDLWKSFHQLSEHEIGCLRDHMITHYKRLLIEAMAHTIAPNHGVDEDDLSDKLRIYQGMMHLGLKSSVAGMGEDWEFPKKIHDLANLLDQWIMTHESAKVAILEQLQRQCSGFGPICSHRTPLPCIVDDYFPEVSSIWIARPTRSGSILSRFISTTLSSLSSSRRSMAGSDRNSASRLSMYTS